MYKVLLKKGCKYQTSIFIHLRLHHRLIHQAPQHQHTLHGFIEHIKAQNPRKGLLFHNITNLIPNLWLLSNSCLILSFLIYKFFIPSTYAFTTICLSNSRSTFLRATPHPLQAILILIIALATTNDVELFGGLLTDGLHSCKILFDTFLRTNTADEKKTHGLLRRRIKL